MNIQKIVTVARKLAAIVEKEFPFITEDEAREAIAKTLIDLHFEPKILPQLFADKWETEDDLV
jgi:hypothetical protein